MAKAHLDNRENFRCGVQYEDDVKRKENACRAMKDSKGKSTWGTAISFGFHRRTPEPAKKLDSSHHPRSASAAPPLDRQHYGSEQPPRPHNSPKIHPTTQAMPQHAEPPRMTLRNNWVDARHQKHKNANNDNNISNYNHEQTLTQTDRLPPKQRTILESTNRPTASRIPHSSPVHTNPSYNNNYNNNNNNNVSNVGTNRKTASETAGKYTLHTSHLPLPQYAVRMTNANANTAKPGSSIRKYSPGPRGCAALKDESLALNEARARDQQNRYNSKHHTAHRNFVNDYSAYNRQVCDKFGKLKLADGKTFEVRDVDDSRTVTEISVIPLPKSAGSANVNTNPLRDQKPTPGYSSSNRCVQYGMQTLTNTRNENSHKDSSNSDTIPSLNMDFDTSGFDSPEYGHGEAMADECSSGSDENRRELLEPSISALCQNTKPLYYDSIYSTMNGHNFEKKKLASVLLSLEDPAFAAAAATETSMIDDETLPVDFNTSIISNGSMDGSVFKKKPYTEQAEDTFANGGSDFTKASSNSFRLTGRKEDAHEKSCRQLLFTPKEVHDENNSIRKRMLLEANELRGQSKFANSRIQRDNTETDSITWSSYELYDEDELPSDNCHSITEKRFSNYFGTNGLCNGHSPDSGDSDMPEDRTASLLSASPRNVKKHQSPRLVPKKTTDGQDADNWSMEPQAYQNMIKEIFDIKSTLKMLTKILHQETDSFESPVDDPETEPIAATSTRRVPITNELSDLKRQVVYLQGQLLDKERSIHSLQLLLAKFQKMHNTETQKADSSPLRRNVNTRRTVNATTQTMFCRRFQMD